MHSEKKGRAPAEVAKASDDVPSDSIESVEIETIPRVWPRIFKPTIVCGAFISCALLVGFASVTASFLPFDFLHAKARELSKTGQIPFFTLDFYQKMRLRLQVLGVASIIVAALTFIFRGRVRQFLAGLATDAVRLVAAIASEWNAIPAPDLIALALLVLLAAFLRLPLLSQPMRGDEAFTVLRYASNPLYVALSLYTEPNNHLFHTLLVHFTYVLFGYRPWALRLPAFIAGLLLVPATYAAARSLYRTEGAVLAAGMTACSSMLIEFSTNARGYTIVCLLFMMLIPLAAYMIRERGWTACFLFSILASIGLYTIPIMLYPLGGIALWLLLCAPAGDAAPNSGGTVSRLFVAGLLTATLTTVLYSPVFAVFGPGPVFSNRWVKSLRYHQFIRELPPSLASTWREWNRDLPLFLTIALVAGFGISLIWRRGCDKFRSPLPLALALWIFLLLSIQRVVPFERVWMFALPLYFVASTAGLALLAAPLLKSLRIRHGMLLLAGAASLFAAWHFRRSEWIYSTNEGRGMEATATYLKPRLAKGDSVVVSPLADAPLEFYFRQQQIPITYFNAPVLHNLFVVVSEVAEDTLSKVFAERNMDPPKLPDRPVAQFDSALVYEVPATE
jgi:hypothetical protein